MYLKKEQPVVFRLNIKRFTLATVLSLLLMVISAHAVTPELTYIDEDIVDAVWTVDNSPYIITANINVLSSLIINPGVEVHFAGSYGIEVNPGAIMRAIGSDDVSSDRIVFTGASIIWQGLRFNTVNDTSILANCDIINAATAINCIRSDIEITGCRIEAHSIAINCNNSSPYIHNNPLIRVIGESDVPANYSAISISDQSAPLIIGNEMIECCASHSSNATGIQIWESNPRIEENWIEVSSNSEVCGIDADFSNDINIQKNIIRVHSAPFTRGLEFVNSVTVWIYNNDILIIGSPISTSIGIRVDARSSVSLTNNIFVGNGDGTGLLARNANFDQQSGYNLIHNFNEAYTAGLDSLLDNIYVDPLFNEDNDPLLPEYYLQELSLCIDAGNPGEDWYDEYGTRSEIGAYSFEPPNIVAEHNLRLPVKFDVEPAYPNPFNSQIRFAFNLQSESMVRIAVYDIGGRMIRLLGENNYRAGVHNINWKSENRSAGVYILKLEVEGESHSQRLIYIP